MEEGEQQPKRKRVKAKEQRQSPDISQLQAIRLDSRTVFYVKMDEDPKKAKKRLIKKYMQAMTLAEKAAYSHGLTSEKREKSDTEL
jgi:hypothetical protein